MDKKLTIVLAGSVATHSGYGGHARDIARALIKSDKYDVKIVPIRWGSTQGNALNPDNPDDKIILDRIIPPEMVSTPDIFIHVTIPNEFQKVGRYNIGITAGIETTLCRAEWIEGCNRMDLVIATSEHSKAVFKNSKYTRKEKSSNTESDVVSLTRPVEVLFEGIKTDVYNSQPDKSLPINDKLNSIPEDFCFLFVGHWLQGNLGNDRKDIGMLIRTFLESFKMKTKRNMPALILKTSLAGFSIIERDTILGYINDVRNMVRSNGWNKPLPNIYLLYGDLSDQEMNALYNHDKVKAMVSFTKGEGFGRPLLEFTMTGKPVLAPAWSGQLDFLHPAYSILLPGTLGDVHESAQNEWIVKGSQWFTVNYGVASERMLDVHKRYDLHLSQSKKHRKYTKETFSFERMMSKLCFYIDNIEKYANMKVEVPSMVKPGVLSFPKLTKIKSGESVDENISLQKTTEVKNENGI